MYEDVDEAMRSLPYTVIQDLFGKPVCFIMCTALLLCILHRTHTGCMNSKLMGEFSVVNVLMFLIDDYFFTCY